MTVHNISWTRYLPRILQEWLTGRHQLQMALDNTGWLLFERMLRIVAGLVIGAWVARYLGPSQFGELAYVISFLAFFQVVADLQADGFIIRDITQEREEASIILGTVLWLRLGIAVLSWLAAVVFMLVLHPKDFQLILLTAIVGATMVFRTSDTIDYWFQSQSQSKRTVTAKLFAFLLSSCVRIALLIFKAPLIAFAGVMCFECAVAALALSVAYHRFPTKTPWKATIVQAKTLLSLCWPFIISSLMITVFLKIDQIMLKEMLGERQLGIFAAALPISQVWTVIPTTLVVSLAPFVARKFSQDEALYRDALVKIFRFFALMSTLGAVCTAAISPWLINLMYGAQYQYSAVILSVHVFTNILIFQGIAQDLWVINKNVRRVTLIATFSAAVVGVSCNMILIKKFGPLGAVFSYMLATSASVVIVPCLLRRDLLDLYKRAFFGIAKA